MSTRYVSGNESNLTVNDEDFLYVQSGGTATLVTVNGGGTEVVHGTAEQTTINTSGLQTVGGYTSYGGANLADETTINGGTQQVLSGGTASNTTISGTSSTQGTQTVEYNGTAMSTRVDGFGLLTVQSGGSAGGVTINAGTADFKDGAQVARSEGNRFITFGEGAGSLIIEEGQTSDRTLLKGDITGNYFTLTPSLVSVGAGDSIDLTQFDYIYGETAVYHREDRELDVMVGSVVVFAFEVIDASTDDFKVTRDSSGGTLITAGPSDTGGGSTGGGSTGGGSTGGGSSTGGGGSTGGSPAGGGGSGSPVGGGTVAPPTNTGASPPSNNSTAPVVAFDPDVAIARGDVITFSGTYAAAAGVSSIIVSEGATVLGAAAVNPDGTWSLAVDYTDRPGPHSGFTASLTDAQGGQAASSGPYSLITDYPQRGPEALPYRTVEDKYNPITGDYTGSTFFNRNGTEYFESSYASTAEGGSVYTYAGGTYFRTKDYSSFSDSYDRQDPDNPTSHAQNNNDGTRTVFVYGPGLTLDGAADVPTRFVFQPGVGQVAVEDFSATGPNRDSIDIGNASSARLTAILHTEPDIDGNLTLNIGHGNSVTLIGVDHVTKRDFTHLA